MCNGLFLASQAICICRLIANRLQGSDPFTQGRVAVFNKHFERMRWQVAHVVRG